MEKKNKLDFVIVGFGGGGSLAANLALTGFTFMFLRTVGKEVSVSSFVSFCVSLVVDNKEYYRWFLCLSFKNLYVF